MLSQTPNLYRTRKKVKKKKTIEASGEHPNIPISRAPPHTPQSLYSASSSARSPRCECSSQPTVPSVMTTICTTQQPHRHSHSPIFLRRGKYTKLKYYKKQNHPHETVCSFLYCNMTPRQSARHKTECTHRCKPNRMRNAYQITDATRSKYRTDRARVEKRVSWCKRGGEKTTHKAAEDVG